MTTLPAAHSDRSLEQRFAALSRQIRAAASDRSVELLAVSKTRPAEIVSALAACGQRAFGENYVQEADAKIQALAHLSLRWHLIGHLQSNKANIAARLFDCVETVDRAKLLPLLDTARGDSGRPPLDILLQVNIDDESSKSGCRPEDLSGLAEQAVRYPHLRLRGLMSIPAPAEDPARRRASFAALRRLFDVLKLKHPQLDTLSMGMSEDFELAIEEGSSLVRVGSALFGPRAPRVAAEPEDAPHG